MFGWSFGWSLLVNWLLLLSHRPIPLLKIDLLALIALFSTWYLFLLALVFISAC